MIEKNFKVLWLRLTSCSSLLLRLSDSPTSRLQDLPG